MRGVSLLALALALGGAPARGSVLTSFPVQPCDDDAAPFAGRCLPRGDPCHVLGTCPANAHCEAKDGECIAECNPGHEAIDMGGGEFRCAAYDPCQTVPCPPGMVCFRSRDNPDQCIANCRAGYRQDKRTRVCTPNPPAKLVPNPSLKPVLAPIPRKLREHAREKREFLNKSRENCEKCVENGICEHQDGRCGVTCEPGHSLLSPGDGCAPFDPCTAVRRRPGVLLERVGDFCGARAQQA
eukprot:TRINITY_DN10351_c1_g1_i1.p2 TRINITY_DN10351_c1_g1~~TRINITY_DN10351_c1_g1_i1.p2  ORF type:complete len:255 (-),score=83.40 TRINITY_DN10351_c1_g1_i1:64-783(-)